jgi:hypothetical protein
LNQHLPRENRLVELILHIPPVKANKVPKMVLFMAKRQSLFEDEISVKQQKDSPLNEKSLMLTINIKSNCHCMKTFSLSSVKCYSRDDPVFKKTYRFQIFNAKLIPMLKHDENIFYFFFYRMTAPTM